MLFLCLMLNSGSLFVFLFLFASFDERVVTLRLNATWHFLFSVDLQRPIEHLVCLFVFWS